MNFTKAIDDLMPVWNLSKKELQLVISGYREFLGIEVNGAWLATDNNAAQFRKVCAWHHDAGLIG